MASPLSSLLILALFIVHALAAMKFTSPEAGDSFDVSDGVEIKWKDNGDDPALDTLTSVTILLCTGSNSNINCFLSLAASVALSTLDDSYAATISQSAAASGSFYFQLTSLVNGGPGYVISYTPRFTLTGMSGTVEPSDGGDTDPPDTVYVEGSTTSGAATGTAITNSFDVPYIDQATWLTKYAPMQTQPGSTVTATGTKPLYSATSWTAFTTFAASASQVTTLTQGWDYTLTSLVNEAPTAASPSDNGGSHQKLKKLKKRWDDYEEDEEIVE
ncbi:glycoprotein [Myxozyma melibiosi]|uniref:Glycoprotein n=1 Tax=Myxozyma melibiosi TaxID=54550 RepID=A0ABR1F5D1_9ASCO